MFLKLISDSALQRIRTDVDQELASIYYVEQTCVVLLGFGRHFGLRKLVHRNIMRFPHPNNNFDTHKRFKFCL
ncbi:hypothetical protein OUZ56_014688 [Daphnia magna]|uniref:Uncharacterized protein n=1 Tax=Daphnia magna TaxID=35525 RepID=A0ABR0AKI2_9CRUS|nr:hypothetical protein OUZ56_014688 [Daphnia magna]